MMLMTTTENTFDYSAYGLVAPEAPQIPAASAEAFFRDAPRGTVVEVYGDLFQALDRRQWRALESLVPGHWAGTSEHDTTTAESLARMARSSYGNPRLLRLGDAD